MSADKISTDKGRSKGVAGASAADGATVDEATSNSLRFRLPDSSDFEELDHDDAKKARLTDYLRGSLQMQHLAIFCGSGTSMESGGPSMQQLWVAAQGLDDFGKVQATVGYPNGDNIEEFLSRCDAFLELNPNDTSVKSLRAATIATILSKCQTAGRSISERAAHQDLLKKVARRRARDSRVKLFTTNYDLCFELAAGDLGLVPIDGFSFGTTRRFEPQFFDFDIVKRNLSSEGASFVPGVFHYYKLHGSVDWAARGDRIEVDAKVQAEEACLIYPARTKFQRSYQQPHLELMARYLASLREHNTCFVVVGFGFGDAHLFAPIFAALRANPHFRLIVVSRKIDEKLASAADGSTYAELRELAARADVLFVKSSFKQFVKLIPDLSALSPAHELAAAVARVAGKSR
jgi:SIR2-like domain